jgi:twitching motility protein PilI
MSDAQTPFQILLEIDQRCRALAAGLPSQQAAVQTWSGIGFRMGERFFVAPMGEVGEVLHEPRYTLLPVMNCRRCARCGEFWWSITRKSSLA